MKEIIPSNNSKLRIKVDDEDYPLLSRFKWFITAAGYAKTHIRGMKQVSMHHLVYGAIENVSLVIDHLNRDKLDNRKSNLRLCTQSANNKNRKCKGYTYDTKLNKYRVRYMGEFYGRYDTEEEAKRVYRLAKSGQEYQKTRRKLYMLPKNISKQFGKYVVFVQKDGKRLRKTGILTLEEAISWRDKFYKELGKED